MKRFLLALPLIILVSLSAKAYDGENNFTHNRLSMSGMLTSSDCWQFEMSYHYMFWKYLGIGGGVGTLKNYFVDGYASGRGWHINGDDEKPQHIYLRPSVVIRSPSIRIKQTRWGLYLEPGAFMTLPYTSVTITSYDNWQKIEFRHASTKKGQWFATDVHLGLYIDIGPASISFGYTWSNFDIYSQFRHLSYKGTSFSEFYPSKPSMHGAFLSVSAHL
ncbi:MAG: hypothetical protein K2J10_03310 [Muribaculaceae bacterium]|nr:hypothetical protein [Muribaculaceae bacterium]